MKVDNIYFAWRHKKDGTLCLAYANPPKGTLKEVEPTVVGESRLNSKDHYDAAIGRKVSLLKALQELTNNNLIPDDFRPRAWEIYRTMTKSPRWQNGNSQSN